MSEGVLIDEWHRCYGEAWGSEIVSDAVSHPAKYSRALIRRIYQHCVDEKWIEPGSIILDPFGGVALGAIEAMRLGCNWLGCELEPKFVELGANNIDLWNLRYSSLPRWGSARIIQGDSRFLANVIGDADVCCSSPPYACVVNPNGEGPGMAGNERQRKAIYAGSANEHAAQSRNIGYGSHPSQLGNLRADQSGFELAVSSPPFREARSETTAAGTYAHGGPCTDRADAHVQQYGSDGNLSRMSEGSIDLAVASPPFVDQLPQQDKSFRMPHDTTGNIRGDYGNSDGQLGQMKEGSLDACVSSPPFTGVTPHDGGKAEFITDKYLFGDYGTTEGQLSAMSHSGFDQAVSSPPFEESLTTRSDISTLAANGINQDGSIRGGSLTTGDYGSSNGNIGNSTGNDFWSASRMILEQVHSVLRPGAHCCWVLKGFIRNKQYVDFPGQWRQLCEAVGFVTLHEHHAMLTEHRGTQMNTDGEAITKTVERKSFFRRLAESKGSPKIDFETILCCLRP